MKKLFILSVFLLSSCGSRKVEKNKEEVKQKETLIENSTKVKIDTSKVETNQIDTRTKTIESNLSKFEFEPFDNDKPFFIGDVKYENVKVKQSTEKTITQEQFKSELKRLEQFYLNELDKNYKEYRNEIEALKTIKNTQRSEPYILYIIMALVVIFVLLYVNKQIKSLKL